MWLSQLEHLENEYIVARTHIVGHNVCDNVFDLPDVLEIPGVEVFPVVPNPSVVLRNGVCIYDFCYFSWFTMVFLVQSFCRLKQDGKRYH